VDVRDARARLIVAALPAPGETAKLSREESAHARARRLSPGDAVVLIDGSGRTAPSELVELGRDGALVRVGAIVEPAPPARPPVSLLVSGIRPERLAWLVEKATELGAATVTLVESARSQSYRSAAARIPKLERVAREAAKQCERADWPSIGGPLALDRALAADDAPNRLFLDFGGEAFPSRLPREPAAILVGPEGGWSDAERAASSALGWRAVALPAGKLRAETAAVVALALVSAAYVSR
jgi:16S rRNA (uracil1498-N3)-methyltransferase